MAHTQTYYIVQQEPDWLSADAPRVLGIFSTQPLAIAAVENLTPHPRGPYDDYGTLKYVDNDGGDIRILPQNSGMNEIAVYSGHSVVVSSGHSVFLAIHAHCNSISDTAVLGTADDAWAACAGMKPKRPGGARGTWVNEKEWTDEKGYRHSKAEPAVAKRESEVMKRMMKHHWYVKEFVVDSREE